jgi:hypothetical protein
MTSQRVRLTVLTKALQSSAHQIVFLVCAPNWLLPLQLLTPVLLPKCFLAILLLLLLQCCCCCCCCPTTPPILSAPALPICSTCYHPAGSPSQRVRALLIQSLLQTHHRGHQTGRSRSCPSAQAHQSAPFRASDQRTPRLLQPLRSRTPCRLVQPPVRLVQPLHVALASGQPPFHHDPVVPPHRRIPAGRGRQRHPGRPKPARPPCKSG